MINADNYKGIFYKDKKITKFYEGGAHFKYQDLVLELNKLLKESSNISNNFNNSFISKKSKNSNNSSMRKNSSSSLHNGNKNSNNVVSIKFNTLDYDNNSNNRINYKNNSKFKPKKKLYIHLVTETNKKDFQTINSLSVKKTRKNPLETKNNLPIIQSSYFNNISKKILLHKNNYNKDDNLKYKYNLFSPLKDFELARNSKNSKEKIYNEVMKKLMEKNQIASNEIIKNFEHKDNCIVNNFLDKIKKKEKNFKLSQKVIDLKQNSTKNRKIILSNLKF